MHRRTLCLAALAFTGCRIQPDPGPIDTQTSTIDYGKAELARVEIDMTAGKLNVSPGSAKLAESRFQFSKNLGAPAVSYDATGFRGRLRIESPRTMASGDVKNEWDVKLGDKLPLDISINMGAGEGHVNLTALPLRKVEVKMGAGELNLDLRGKYDKGVEAEIRGGVGQATIRLPKDMGVAADVQGGIGSIQATGLTKRDGRYFNDAYSESKPAIKLNVRGGVGEIRLIAE